ncbi:FHA domain-containing protein [Agromyces sp. SYSU T00194]|uniref:FHA domain-containing protein n=1 Tax=Agromyces chitinivorans TaxID=3158560 RepID=UPI00339A9A07
MSTTPEPDEGGPALRITEGRRAGDRIALPEGRATLGRGEDVDIRLDDGGVSRIHAYLDRAGESVRITDVGSTNGTTVNGLPARGAHPLVAGDEVGIGEVRLVLELAPARVPEAAPVPTPVPARATPRRGVRLGRVLVIGGSVEAAVAAVGWIGAAVAGWAIGALWIVAPLVGVAAAGAAIWADARHSRHEAPGGRTSAPQPPAGAAPDAADAAARPPMYTPPPTEPHAVTTEAPRLDGGGHRPTRVSAAVAAVVAVAAVGIGGAALILVVTAVANAVVAGFA